MDARDVDVLYAELLGEPSTLPPGDVEPPMDKPWVSASSTCACPTATGWRSANRSGRLTSSGRIPARVRARPA